MSLRNSYRAINIAQVLAQDWQLGASNNTVTISIYDMTDNVSDVTAAAMTNETGGLFSYAWTPLESHVYRIDYHNSTLNSHEYEIVTITTALFI